MKLKILYIAPSAHKLNPWYKWKHFHLLFSFIFLHLSSVIYRNLFQIHINNIIIYWQENFLGFIEKLNRSSDLFYLKQGWYEAGIIWTIWTSWSCWPISGRLEKHAKKFVSQICSYKGIPPAPDFFRAIFNPANVFRASKWTAHHAQCSPICCGSIGPALCILAHRTVIWGHHYCTSGSLPRIKHWSVSDTHRVQSVHLSVNTHYNEGVRTRDEHSMESWRGQYVTPEVKHLSNSRIPIMSLTRSPFRKTYTVNTLCRGTKTATCHLMEW